AADRTFTSFMAVTILSISGLVWFGAAYVMYLRDVLGVRDSMNISLSALGGLGILLTVGSWARFTEKKGSGLAMAKALLAYSIAPLLFLIVGMTSSVIPAILLLTVLIANIFTAVFFVAVNRAMLNHIPDHDRVGYTVLWTVCTALAFGVTPLAAGFIIEYMGVWGFRLCFLFSMVTTQVSAVLCLIYVHEKTLFKDGWSVILNPTLPLRTLGRIFWITVGLHESNREDPEAGESK
ncbi:MAG: hypothetical protein KAH38_10300, partial [Candidatus Hydrogenedentes bacterium]|nr:hypothetical protein [Candidatus Hydrogenedentota bacterium]